MSGAPYTEIARLLDGAREFYQKSETLNAPFAHDDGPGAAINKLNIAFNWLHRAVFDLLVITKAQHPYYADMATGDMTSDLLREAGGLSAYMKRVGVVDPSPIAPLAICGVISNSGRMGEPLACGKPAGHEGMHAWATLPTYDDEGYDEYGRMARYRGEKIEQLRRAIDIELETNSRLRRELGESAAKYLGLHDLIVATAEQARKLARNAPTQYTTPESAPRSEGAPREE